MAKLKSQVDAPIELVIAVIILLTSISISLLIFGNTSEQQCLAEMKGEIQKLQLAMQDLALQSPPATRTIDFTLPRCGSKKVDLLRFIYFDQPEPFCRKCPGHFSGCWVLQPVTYNLEADRYEPLADQEVCVDISGEFQVATDPEPGCKELTDNPCPAGTDCDPKISGIARVVYNRDSPETSPARFATLQTEGTNYRITLKKDIGVCGGDPTCPKFNICAISPSG
ncbi:MAG: hypothetical protein ABIG96_02275 [Candidatus Micrarchaeota archaeon]